MLLLYFWTKTQDNVTVEDGKYACIQLVKPMVRHGDGCFCSSVLSHNTVYTRLELKAGLNCLFDLFSHVLQSDPHIVQNNNILPSHKLY